MTRLAGLRVAPIADALDSLGHPNQVLAPAVRPLVGERVVGVAYTILVVPTATDSSEYRDDGLAAIDAIPSDAVVVIGTGGNCVAASWGELLSTRALACGAVGVITDGAVRDVEGIRQLDFPTYAACVNSRDASSRLRFREHDVPIVCGGVGVAPGDFVVADLDGVVVIPALVVGPVIEKAEAAIQQE